MGWDWVLQEVACSIPAAPHTLQQRAATYPLSQCPSLCPLHRPFPPPLASRTTPSTPPHARTPCHITNPSPLPRKQKMDLRLQSRVQQLHHRLHVKQRGKLPQHLAHGVAQPLVRASGLTNFYVSSGKRVSQCCWSTSRFRWVEASRPPALRSIACRCGEGCAASNDAQSCRKLTI